MARKHNFIQLHPLEKEFLTRTVKIGTTKAREQNRCRMLLYNDEGKTAKEISILLGVNYVTVTQTLKRFRDNGLTAALYDKPRSGAPKKLTPELEAHASAIACSEAPDGRNRWTIELLTDELIRLQVVDTISKTSVHTLLKKVNLSHGSTKCGASNK